MPDNITITPGAGQTIATDDIGGVNYQRVKISIGADGSATDLAFGQAAKTASLPVVQAARGSVVTSVITRPANVTPYVAGQVVGGAIQFSSIGPSNAPILIRGSRMMLEFGAIPVGMTSFRLHLYSATPPSALANGANWDLPSSDRATYVGFVDLGTPVDVGSTCYCEVNNHDKIVRLTGVNLFGYLVTNGGYTPAANSEVYNVTLTTVEI